MDLMGGDCPPQILFKAVIQAINSPFFPRTCKFVVFATSDIIPTLRVTSTQASRIELVPSQDQILPDDSPLIALRTKKSSTLLEGVIALKIKSIDAFISAGNTGALIAAAALHLSKLTGHTRPGLIARLPASNGYISVIDVGGGVNYTAKRLLSFALFGISFHKCFVKKRSSLKVGLLNVGVEPNKGPLELRKAYQLLENTAKKYPAKMTFVGNIEGRDALDGKVDVLVTDGFTGNIFVKTSEGISSFILSFLKKNLKKEAISDRLLDCITTHLDYEEYPGALVSGVDGIIIKCHGAATPKGLFNAILGSIPLIEKNIIAKFKSDISLNNLKNLER